MHAGASCEPFWSAEFGAEPDDQVWALKAFDDGTGPALYVGGWFDRIGRVEVNGIARWDGTSWSALSGGMTEPLWNVRSVFAMEVFDDGTGSALYAAGRFTKAGGVEANRVARWDGVSWSPLGEGVGSGATFNDVFALAVFDDGTGPALYAGGRFDLAGDRKASNIARWDGRTWSAVGEGVNARVWALQAFDDGTGSALYVGGDFNMAGDLVANRIARWDGRTWSTPGGGMVGAHVYALSVFDHGKGPALYVGGSFSGAGDVDASGIARWDGEAWSALHEGVNGYVGALAVFDDGTGPALIAGGGFTIAGGVGAGRVAKWNGISWSSFGGGLNDMNGCAIAVFDDGRGPKLVVGGSFNSAGGVTVNNLACWDGASWSSPSTRFPNAPVLAMTEFDDGSGPALYVGGEFTLMGNVTADRVAKWDGVAWSALGSGISGPSNTLIRAMAVFDDGRGPALYVGGNFHSAGGKPALRIARWDGRSWSPVGSGITGSGEVLALAVFDDGSGPALYAGGTFSEVGGVSVNRIARWNGDVWSPLGSGVHGWVTVMTVYDDGSGSGPALVVGGDFTSAGGVSAARIAKWDGSSWSAKGSGLNSRVTALAVGDDDSGSAPALYVGGNFSVAGGIVTSRVAKWNGIEWSSVGGGINDPSASVESLAWMDDGTGPALIVGGRSLGIAGGIRPCAVKWDGAEWSAFGEGLTASDNFARVSVLSVVADDNGPSLLMGGLFRYGFGTPIRYFAKWEGCAASTKSCPADISGDGAVDLTDLLAVLAAWGPCGSCPEDLNGDGAVELADLLLLLAAWGACP